MIILYERSQLVTQFNQLARFVRDLAPDGGARKTRPDARVRRGMAQAVRQDAGAEGRKSEPGAVTTGLVKLAVLWLLVGFEIQDLKFEI